MASAVPWTAAVWRTMWVAAVIYAFARSLPPATAALLAAVGVARADAVLLSTLLWCCALPCVVLWAYCTSRPRIFAAVSLGGAVALKLLLRAL